MTDYSALRSRLDRAHQMACSDPTDPTRVTTYSEARDAIDALMAAAATSEAGRAEVVDALAEASSEAQELAFTVADLTRERDDARKGWAGAIQAHRDLHQTYSNTSACHGGIGGSVLTQHCGVTCGSPKHAAQQAAWNQNESDYFRTVQDRTEQTS